MSCDILSPVIAIFSGAIVAFVGDRFAAHRETKNRQHADQGAKEVREHAERTAKEARKRNFLSFLEGFRSEAERSAPAKLAEVFPSRVYKFREEAAKIRGDIDLERQEAFANLVTALCQLRDSDVEEVIGENYLGRTRVTEAIDKVAQFVG